MILPHVVGATKLSQKDLVATITLKLMQFVLNNPKISTLMVQHLLEHHFAEFYIASDPINNDI